jgi:hypothetical protein
LPHVEFAYNCSMHSTIKMCPFEIIYGLLPRAPIDLIPLPCSKKMNFHAKQSVELMLKLHETTKENIERMNAKYKIAGDKGRRKVDFELGDLVWLHLRKEWFPDFRKSKLMPRVDVLFKVLEKINVNAYKLNFLAYFGVSPTFNIADLKVSGSSTSGTTGHRLRPKNLDMTGFLQRQTTGETSTPYQMLSHQSWLKRRGHQCIKKNWIMK